MKEDRNTQRQKNTKKQKIGLPRTQVNSWIHRKETKTLKDTKNCPNRICPLFVYWIPTAGCRKDQMPTPSFPPSLSLSLSLLSLSLSRRFPTRGSIASSRRSSGTSACSNRKNQMGGVKCGGQTWGSNAGVQMRGSNRGGQIGGVKTGGAAGRGACCSRRRGRSRAHASQCTFSFEVTRPDQILEIWQKWGFDI